MGQVIEVRPDGTKRVMYFTEGPSLTRQEFKDECDLEKIVRKYSATPEGREALLKSRMYLDERYQDVSSVLDYRDALESVRSADEAFMRLPAEVRTRFDNDPAKFLDFADDRKNLDEMVKMGLADPVVKPAEAGVKKPEAPTV